MSRQRVREAGAEAVKRAGYREKREYAVVQRAEEMLSLPRVQAGVLEAFAALGVDINKCGAVLAEIMDAPLSVDGPVSATDKLKAVDLVIRTTVGYAPTKSANLHGSVPVDGLFDPDEFAKTPPIKTVSK